MPGNFLKKYLHPLAKDGDGTVTNVCFFVSPDFNLGFVFLQILPQVSLEKGDRKDWDLQEDLWFELSSEALCNWMMFVRPAQNHLEQNLVAYQYGHHIYFTTIKNVEPKQELKVWDNLPYTAFSAE